MKKLTSFLAATIIFFACAIPSFAASTAAVTKGVNFRSAPSVDSTVYRSLSTGTTVTVLEQVNPYWLKVQAGSQVGYVSTGYVNYTSPAAQTPAAPAPPAQTPAAQTPAAVSSSTSKVVQIAESYQGKVHYVFGKNDPVNLVLDCSSFTKLVFSKAGIALPWSSRSQAQQGIFVAKANLKPGDLVFFTVGSSSTIGHVGIYRGNGTFIHNLPNSGVTISDLNSTYWTNHYVTARRVS